MEGVVIIEREVMDALIHKVEYLQQTVLSIAVELNDSRKPYLSPDDVLKTTGFGKSWFNENKQYIGYSLVDGRVRVKRSDLEKYMEEFYFKSKRAK